MVASYHAGATPVPSQIKAIDDWMLARFNYPVNNYNGTEPTGFDLAIIAREYFGLTDSHRYSNWTIAQLQQELGNGNPVIVAVYTSMNPVFHFKHFMVLVGMDATNVYVNDPDRTNGKLRTYPLSQFQIAWKSNANNAVVVIHPDNPSPLRPSLFTTAAMGTGSFGLVTRFDLTSLQPTPIATLNGFAQGMACGLDGKLYVALTGYGCCSPARQIVSLNTDGSGQTTVLDFATTTTLANGGGPDGPSFGADGSLYFNTLFAHGNLPATGVWRLQPGSTIPTQVILPFTSSGASGAATAFLTAPPFVGDLIATDITDNKVVRVAVPFAVAQTATTFITDVLEPAGLAIDTAGNIYVSTGANPATNRVNKYAPDGTPLGPLPPLGGNLARMTFDSAGNLYVGLVNPNGPSVMRIGPDGTTTAFGDVVTSPANGVAVCPRPAISYDAAKDFSMRQNPNGTWSYGSIPMVGGAFTVFGVSDVNTAGYPGLNEWSFGGATCATACPPGYLVPPFVVGMPAGTTIDAGTFGVAFSSGVLMMHPALAYHPPFNQSVVRWTAPASGTFLIGGQFLNGDLTVGARTSVKILKNGIALFTGAINGIGSSAPFSLVNQALNAGDTIDFVVGDNGNGFSHDSTGLMATITAQ